MSELDLDSPMSLVQDDAKRDRGIMLTKVVADELQTAERSCQQARKAIVEIWQDQLYLHMGHTSFNKWAIRTLGPTNRSRLYYLLELGKVERELLVEGRTTEGLSERTLEAIKEAPTGQRGDAYLLVERVVAEADEDENTKFTPLVAKKVIREKYAEVKKVEEAVRDGQGQDVDDYDNREAFRTRRQLKVVQRLFAAAQNELQKLSGKPGADHVNFANVKMKTGQILREIERALPYMECINQNCNGGCGTCLQLKWITKNRFLELDPNDCPE